MVNFSEIESELRNKLNSITKKIEKEENNIKKTKTRNKNLFQIKRHIKKFIKIYFYPSNLYLVNLYNNL